MSKLQLKDLPARIKTLFRQKISPRLARLPDYLILFVSSWWHIILIALAALIFLYYPIGGMMVSKIDTDTSYEIKEPETGQSAAVDMMAFIINREVNEKMWTPNLPFFFPSYFLDNMPAFQLGMFDSLAKFSTVMARQNGKLVINGDSPHHLQEAAELLKYPGTIWMFSPANRLRPVPSANTQYRKARKHLIKFNASLAGGSEIWYKSPEELSRLLSSAGNDLWQTASRRLERQIRENSADFIDNKADDVFYYGQGKAYAYYLLFNALGRDYKEIIVKKDAYGIWTSMLKALEDASKINPSVIRNGRLDSFGAPNHLAALGFYILKAQTLMNRINDKINISSPNKE